MTDNKKLLFITGTTCVGKSTLLHTLKEARPDQVYIIPQTTVRTPRSDDEAGDFRYVTELKLSDMFLYDKEHRYGVAWQDIISFQQVPQKFGVGIVSSDEIEMLSRQKNKIPDICCHSILMTFSYSVENEIKILDKTLTDIFDENIKKLRMDYFRRLIQERLLNPKFIQERINIHITREMTAGHRYQSLTNLTGIPIQLLANTMKKIVDNKQVQRHYLSTSYQSALSNTR